MPKVVTVYISESQPIDYFPEFNGELIPELSAGNACQMEGRSRN
jgi:hypothetical protein